MPTVRSLGGPVPSSERGQAAPGHEPRGFDVAPDAERFLAPVAGDFGLSAGVSVVFGSTFDAGVLIGDVDELTRVKIRAELDGRRLAGTELDCWPEGSPRLEHAIDGIWLLNGPAHHDVRTAWRAPARPSSRRAQSAGSWGRPGLALEATARCY